MSLAEIIYGLERRLLDPGTRTSRRDVEDLLADDFREIGKSGRLYDRATCIDALVRNHAELTYRIDSFALRELAPDLSLATYALSITAPEASASLRSSLWAREADGKWRMLFHQGTSVRIAESTD